jgi:hypothetical protein
LAKLQLLFGFANDRKLALAKSSKHSAVARVVFRRRTAACEHAKEIGKVAFSRSKIWRRDRMQGRKIKRAPRYRSFGRRRIASLQSDNASF